jgi:hypothetical protein
VNTSYDVQIGGINGNIKDLGMQPTPSPKESKGKTIKLPDGTEVTVE